MIFSNCYRIFIFILFSPITKTVKQPKAITMAQKPCCSPVHFNETSNKKKKKKLIKIRMKNMHDDITILEEKISNNSNNVIFKMEQRKFFIIRCRLFYNLGRFLISLILSIFMQISWDKACKEKELSMIIEFFSFN